LYKDPEYPVKIYRLVTDITYVTDTLYST